MLAVIDGKGYEDQATGREAFTDAHLLSPILCSGPPSPSSATAARAGIRGTRPVEWVRRERRQAWQTKRAPRQRLRTSQIMSMMPRPGYAAKDAEPRS